MLNVLLSFSSVSHISLVLIFTPKEAVVDTFFTYQMLTSDINNLILLFTQVSGFHKLG